MKKECISKIVLMLFLIIIFVSFISVQISAQKYSVKVTTEHPFLLASGNYIPASQLKVGDKLKTTHGKIATVKGIEKYVLDNPFEVYNLEDSFFHNYVTEGGVVVHNSDIIDNEIESLITKTDLNAISKEDLFRINDLESRLQRKLNPSEKKTLIGVHRYRLYESIHDICAENLIDYKKGRALRNIFSEADTRIIMEEGYAGKLYFNSNGNKYWRLDKNHAISQWGIERWLDLHTVSPGQPNIGQEVIIDEIGIPWTRERGREFINGFIKQINDNYNPNRLYYDTPIFFDKTNRKKIRFRVLCTQSDSTFKEYVGGAQFHGEFVEVR